MAIYVVGQYLIRARNGNHAKEIAGEPDAVVSRVTEEGGYGFVNAPAQEDDMQAGEVREIDITDLSDKHGQRRYKNLKTGDVRIEQK